MKIVHVLLKSLLLGTTLFSLTACESDCNCPEISTPDKNLTRELEDTRPFRQRLVNSISDQVNQVPTVGRFKFSMDLLPKGIEPQDLEIFTNTAIEAKAENYANVEATELVTSIFNALIAAESLASQLDVKFSVSEKPVDNGNLIFTLETPKSQELTLTMYDEEDFAMVANNVIVLNEGNNYKALNVSSLEPGEYIFKLSDEKDGKELVRRINIADKK